MEKTIVWDHRRKQTEEKGYKICHEYHDMFGLLELMTWRHAGKCRM